jgi:hypothetical protein
MGKGNGIQERFRFKIRTWNDMTCKCSVLFRSVRLRPCRHESRSLKSFSWRELQCVPSAVPHAMPLPGFFFVFPYIDTTYC